MVTDYRRVILFVVSITVSLVAAAAGAALQAAIGYRSPMIVFYPAIMISDWYGGVWPGVTATAVSAVLAEYLWLAPLRAKGQGTLGDIVALTLFIGVGVTISAL